MVVDRDQERRARVLQLDAHRTFRCAIFDAVLFLRPALSRASIIDESRRTLLAEVGIMINEPIALSERAATRRMRSFAGEPSSFGFHVAHVIARGPFECPWRIDSLIRGSHFRFSKRVLAIFSLSLFPFHLTSSNAAKTSFNELHNQLLTTVQGYRCSTR